jgi:hypothetical protein
MSQFQTTEYLLPLQLLYNAGSLCVSHSHLHTHALYLSLFYAHAELYWLEISDPAWSSCEVAEVCQFEKLARLKLSHNMLSIIWHGHEYPNAAVPWFWE